VKIYHTTEQQATAANVAKKRQIVSKMYVLLARSRGKIGQQKRVVALHVGQPLFYSSYNKNDQKPQPE
jgi:precorrin-2 methylase